MNVVHVVFLIALHFGERSTSSSSLLNSRLSAPIPFLPSLAGLITLQRRNGWRVESFIDRVFGHGREGRVGGEAVCVCMEGGEKSAEEGGRPALSRHLGWAAP